MHNDMERKYFIVSFKERQLRVNGFYLVTDGLNLTLQHSGDSTVKDHFYNGFNYYLRAIDCAQLASDYFRSEFSRFRKRINSSSLQQSKHCVGRVLRTHGFSLCLRLRVLRRNLS